MASIILIIFFDQVAFYTLGNNSTLSEALKILQRDKSLLWKQKSNLRTTFFKTDVATDHLGFRNTNKDPLAYTQSDILILGASPSFGWGVEQSDTYSYLLEAEFRKHNPNFNVYNASVIGFSSFQGQKLLKATWASTLPKIVIIAYGLNDVDYLRFFFSDNKTDKEVVPRFNKLASVLDKSGMAQTLTLLKNKPQNGDCAHAPSRVSAQDYLTNISSMIEYIESKGSLAILLLIPILPPDLSRKENVENLRCYQQIRTKLNLYYDNLKQRFDHNQILSLENTLNAPQHFLVEQKDFIHPSPLGHRIISQHLTRFIEEIKETPRTLLPKNL